MKSKLFLLFFIVFSYAFSQKNITISGYVEDKDTGEKLIGATVYDKNTLKGTITNVYGFYSLTLPAGDVQLEASYVGYDNFTEQVTISENTFKNILLSAGESLEEVVVSSSVESTVEKTQMSAITIPVSKVAKLPAFFGEVDVIKAVQLLPGVQSGGEGTTGLYVRGGGPDQNLILLDGVPVYNPNHLFGFFSVFNSAAINNVELIKGGFPARYNGRVSSVLDIRMKEGNNKELKGEASIGLLSSKLTLEGPIIKDKTSFIISGRRTYADLLAQPFLPADQNGGYYFYDINAKINHRFSDKSTLFLSFFSGSDAANFFLRNEGEINKQDFNETRLFLGWGNTISTLRYNHIISEKLFFNFTGTYSRYGFESSTKVKSYAANTTTETNIEIGTNSGIFDFGGKLEFDYIPNSNHYIRFGLGDTYHTFKPGGFNFRSSASNNQNAVSGSSSFDFGSSDIYTHEIFAFIEDDFKIGDKLKINAGINANLFLVKEQTYRNIQPRLAVNYLLKDNLSLKGSYSKMYQFVHLLASGAIGLPNDLWVPITDKLPPVDADQIALGSVLNIDNTYEISLEGYYKTMNNLIEYKDGASFFGNASDWQEKVELGKGWAYGAELFVQKKVGKTTGWLGYTLSWSNRQFENLNNNEIFPYKFDRRHDISFVLVHEFTKTKPNPKYDVDLGMTWVYGTGKSVTLPTSKFATIAPNSFYNLDYNSDVTIDNFTGRNNFREPAYHRLDLSLNFKQNTTKRFKKEFSISVYNAYARQNPFYLYVDNNSLKQLSIFGIPIPSFVYRLTF